METPDPVAPGALNHAELAALGLRPEALLDYGMLKGAPAVAWGHSLQAT